MKVSLLAPDLSGGGGTRVYLLGQVLQKLGYEVKVYGFLFGKKIYPLPPANLPVQTVRGCHYPQVLASVRELLKVIDGDIYYAVKPRPTSFGIALLKHLFSRCPVLLDIDDWEMSWFGGDEWQYRPSLKQLARDILKNDGAFRDPQHPFYLKWMERLIERADTITVDTTFCSIAMEELISLMEKIQTCSIPTSSTPMRAEQNTVWLTIAYSCSQERLDLIRVLRIY